MVVFLSSFEQLHLAEMSIMVKAVLCAIIAAQLDLSKHDKVIPLKFHVFTSVPALVSCAVLAVFLTGKKKGVYRLTKVVDARWTEKKPSTRRSTAQHSAVVPNQQSSPHPV